MVNSEFKTGMFLARFQVFKTKGPKLKLIQWVKIAYIMYFTFHVKLSHLMILSLPTSK